MFQKPWVLIIAMLAGAEAQRVEANDADFQDQLVENMIDVLVDKLNNRVLAASRAQDEGLDGTTLGKAALAPAGAGHLAIPSARLPAVPMQAGMGSHVSHQLNPMLNGGLIPAGPLAGYQCVPTVVQNAEAVKKKGWKVVEGRDVPFNLFKPKEPLKAKVIKNDAYPHTITSDTGDANWETVHVTFEHEGKFPYLEGMSLGVISPGPDKTGKTPAAVRLYSIASSAVGDNENEKTVSLCVKRVVELDGKFANREVGEDKPDKAGTNFPKNKVYRGVASNYICDLNVGDEVLITGPVGTEMLLPQDPDSVLIMLATGTGIAPMRSYLRLLFNDKAGAASDGSRKFKGLAWLFLGVPYSKSLLYDDENQMYKKEFPDQYRYEYAISREQKNAAGQKMYIQTKLAEYAEELWDLLQYKKTHIYMCGLKGMESGMAEALSPIASSKGFEWNELVKEWKKAGRWHVEVY